jgi:hypothetical protein
VIDRKSSEESFSSTSEVEKPVSYSFPGLSESIIQAMLSFASDFDVSLDVLHVAAMSLLLRLRHGSTSVQPTIVDCGNQTGPLPSCRQADVTLAFDQSFSAIAVLPGTR